MTHRRVAFTLVELLVVISIIALLVALLLPALASARETARRIVCGGHFRQIMIAQLNYGNDNGYFPVMPGDIVGGTGWQNLSPPNTLYMAFARNYLDPGIDSAAPNSVVFCPSNTTRSPTLGGIYGGVQYQSALGSSPGDPTTGYFNTPIWMRIDKGNIVTGGGAMCYDSVAYQYGTYFMMNNHGWMPDGMTVGGNVAFYDGHVMWEGNTHWTALPGLLLDGTTYPNDHPAVRVWGPDPAVQFGYGPPGPTLWQSFQFQPFFD